MGAPSVASNPYNPQDVVRELKELGAFMPRGYPHWLLETGDKRKAETCLKVLEADRLDSAERRAFEYRILQRAETTTPVFYLYAKYLGPSKTSPKGGGSMNWLARAYSTAIAITRSASRSFSLLSAGNAAA